MRNFDNPEVANLFDTYPESISMKLLFLRELIFDVALRNQEIGELEETLKWGQSSYVTAASKSGSTIRIDQIKTQAGQYAIYFHCQTNLVETFKHFYPTLFKFDGNRSILFDERDTVPVEELSHCVGLALTYHLSKAKKKHDHTH